MKTRWITAAATVTTAALAVLCASSAFAFPDQGNKMEQKKPGDKKTMTQKMDKMHKMEAPKGAVYVCEKCKTYYTPGMAKKMNFTDPMGHKLIKMDKAPKGMKMGSPAMKMDKMHKMDHKMKEKKPM